MPPMKSKKFVKSFIKTKAKDVTPKMTGYKSVDANNLRSPEPDKNPSVDNSKIDSSKAFIIPCYPANSEEDTLYLINGENKPFKMYQVTCRIAYKDPDCGVCLTTETFPVVAHSVKEVPELAKKYVSDLDGFYKGKSPTFDSIMDLYIRLRVESVY